MKIQTIINIVIIGLVLVIIFIVLDSAFNIIESERACSDIAGKYKATNKATYCIYSDDYAKEVVINCKGLLFNKECTAIEIKND